MQITGLPASSAFGTSDVLAIEINGVTYKITGATLAAALQSMGDYVTAQDIVNNLTTAEAGYVLDARQGKALLDALDAIGASDVGAVAVDQGTANAGKALVVGADGNVTTGNAGIPEAVKVSLLNCFAHVAWIDEHGQTYYDNLYDALYPESALVRLEAVFTQGSAVVYPTTPLVDLKAYLTVTGYYNDGTSGRITDYALSGTLSVGTSTITVTKEGKTATFTVIVSAPYWDYEWSASSRTLPEGMTAVAYDFTTEEGALYAKEPNLNFDYIGNCRIQVEMAGFAINSKGAVVFRGSNPQVQIINSVSGDNKQGIKFIWNFDGAGTDVGLGAVGINGVNTVLNIDTTTYHLIDITNDNNVYTLEVDGNPIALQQNTNQTPYLDVTGISTAHSTSTGTCYYAYIKTIKFKKL